MPNEPRAPAEIAARSAPSAAAWARTVWPGSAWPRPSRRRTGRRSWFTCCAFDRCKISCDGCETRHTAGHPSRLGSLVRSGDEPSPATTSRSGTSRTCWMPTARRTAAVAATGARGASSPAGMPRCYRAGDRPARTHHPPDERRRRPGRARRLRGRERGACCSQLIAALDLPGRDLRRRARGHRGRARHRRRVPVRAPRCSRNASSSRR